MNSPNLFTADGCFRQLCELQSIFLLDNGPKRKSQLGHSIGFIKEGSEIESAPALTSRSKSLLARPSSSRHCASS